MQFFYVGATLNRDPTVRVKKEKERKKGRRTRKRERRREEKEKERKRKKSGKKMEKEERKRERARGAMFSKTIYVGTCWLRGRPRAHVGLCFFWAKEIVQ